MTRELAISLLRSGNNGAQILQILESIDSGSDAEYAAGEPTADPIEF